MKFAHYEVTIPFDAVAENLVNSYDNTRSPPEYLQSTTDLKAFLGAHGLRARRLSEADLQAVRLLRSRVRRMFEARGSSHAVHSVNALLKSAQLHLELESARRDIQLGWRVNESSSVVDQLSSAVALNLAFLLERFGMERFRVCVTKPCRDVFVDVSKSGTRRYCGMTCANRARVASFRERKRTEQ